MRKTKIQSRLPVRDRLLMEALTHAAAPGWDRMSEPDPDRLSRTVRAAQTAFYESEASRSLTRFEFLRQQSRYIQKRWWMLQLLLLLALCGLLFRADGSVSARRGFGIAAPLFVVLVMPELWKNQNAGAVEVEGAAYFTLRQIYAARLTLFAAADLLLLSLFCGAAVGLLRIGLLELAVQFFLPFNVTCCICFTVLYSRRFSSEGLAVTFCGIWTGVWFRIVLNDRLFAAATAPVWCALLVLSLAYLAYCIAKGQRNCHLLWEENILWN